MKGKNTLNHMLFTPQTQASYSSLTLMQKLSVHPTDRNISVQNEADEAAYNTISRSFMYSETSGSISRCLHSKYKYENKYTNACTNPYKPMLLFNILWNKIQ